MDNILVDTNAFQSRILLAVEPRTDSEGEPYTDNDGRPLLNAVVALVYKNNWGSTTGDTIAVSLPAPENKNLASLVGQPIKFPDGLSARYVAKLSGSGQNQKATLNAYFSAEQIVAAGAAATSAPSGPAGKVGN